MRQYVYVSTAESLDSGAIESIVATAQRNNARNGITGFLLYNGRNFLQLIEGDRADVITLMGRIATDSRHDGIVRLHDGEADARACPGWSMQRLRLVNDPAQRRAAIAEELPDDLAPSIRQLVMNFAGLN